PLLAAPDQSAGPAVAVLDQAVLAQVRSRRSSRLGTALPGEVPRDGPDLRRRLLPGFGAPPGEPASASVSASGPQGPCGAPRRGRRQPGRRPAGGRGGRARDCLAPAGARGAARRLRPVDAAGRHGPRGVLRPGRVQQGGRRGSEEEGFRSLRTAELKHGRAAMMAALGFAAQQHVKFPGFESVPEGVGAVATAPGTYGFAALFLFAGAMELAAWTQDPKKEAGNFGDPLGLSNLFGYDEDMRNTGLNNGRFAMFAAIGILSAELLTSKVGMNQF
ncbi:unnamed protein product, partial [Prorocentrum cordatum]